jgi:hypothetical protein
MALADELSGSSVKRLQDKRDGKEITYFPDEHFRLGFEDFPISYPVIFEEFLFSNEMFYEYFSKDLSDQSFIESCHDAITMRDVQILSNLIATQCSKIAEEKALNSKFVFSKVIQMLLESVKK